ncbi:hypothetical protein SprV_0301166400 [Sparganum proliferum]
MLIVSHPNTTPPPPHYYYYHQHQHQHHRFDKFHAHNDSSTAVSDDVLHVLHSKVEQRRRLVRELFYSESKLAQHLLHCLLFPYLEPLSRQSHEDRCTGRATVDDTVEPALWRFTLRPLVHTENNQDFNQH